MAVWRDISLLWLIFLTLIAVLPISVILFLMVRGLHRLRILVKQHSPQVRDKAQLMATTTERASQKIAAPIISMKVRTAQVLGVRDAVLARRKTE